MLQDLSSIHMILSVEQKSVMFVNFNRTLMIYHYSVIILLLIIIIANIIICLPQVLCTLFFLYYRLVNYKTFVYTASKYVLCNYIIVCNNLL